MMHYYGDGDRNSPRRNRVGELKPRPDHEYDIIVLNEREYKDPETKDKPTNIVENTLLGKPFYQGDSLLEAGRLESSYRAQEKLLSAFKGPIPIHPALNNDIQALHELQLPATNLVEETREYKPVYSCVGGQCQKQRQRRLLKVKRKIPAGERRTLQERRRELQERLSQQNPEYNQLPNSEVRTDFKIINRNLTPSQSSSGYNF